MGPCVVAGSSQPALDDVDDRLHVESHAHGLAHHGASQMGLAGVEHEVHGLHPAAGDDGQLGVFLHSRDERCRKIAGDEVEFTRLEPGERRLRVGDHRHDQRVDGRRTLEVVGVGFETVGDTGVVLDHAERAGSHRQRGGIGAGVLDALPDVLGEDRQVTSGKQLERRNRFLEGDLDGRVIQDDRRFEHWMVVHMVSIAPRPAVISEVLEGECDIGGGELDAVVPKNVVAQRHGPCAVVLGRFSGSGQPWLGIETALRPEQRVVDQHREVMGQRQGLGDNERVEVLLCSVQADANHDVVVILCGGRRRQRKAEYQRDENERNGSTLEHGGEP